MYTVVSLLLRQSTRVVSPVADLLLLMLCKQLSQWLHTYFVDVDIVGPMNLYKPGLQRSGLHLLTMVDVNSALSQLPRSFV